MKMTGNEFFRQHLFILTTSNIYIVLLPNTTGTSSTISAEAGTKYHYSNAKYFTPYSVFEYKVRSTCEPIHLLGSESRPGTLGIH